MIKTKKPIGISAVNASNIEAKEKEEQGKLRERYKIKDEEVYIVEKKSLVKFLLQAGINFIKIIFAIISIALSTIGILTIIYEKPRADMIEILTSIYNDVLSTFM